MAQIAGNSSGAQLLKDGSDGTGAKGCMVRDYCNRISENVQSKFNPCTGQGQPLDQLLCEKCEEEFCNTAESFRHLLLTTPTPVEEEEPTPTTSEEEEKEPADDAPASSGGWRTNIAVGFGC